MTFAHRLSFGLDNPIDAATILCAILPFVLAAHVAGRRWTDARHAARLLGEGSILVLVALTGTRTAFVVIPILSLLWFAIFPARPSWRDLAWRALALAIAAALGPVGSRLALADGSISNRFSIYRSGFTAIRAIFPLQHIADPGSFYSNWFEPDTQSYIYFGLHCEPLRFVLQHGLLVGGVALALIVALHLTVLSTCRRQSGLVCRATCSSTGILLFSLLNNTFQNPLTLSLELALLVVLGGALIKDWPAARTTFLGLTLALAGLVAAVSAAVRLAPWPERFEIADYGIVHVVSHPRGTVVAVVDPAVLGVRYGPALRQFLGARFRTENTLVVTAPARLPPGVLTPPPVICFGNACLALPRSEPARIELVYPRFHPQDLPPGFVLTQLVLPPFDPSPAAGAWLDYARRHRLPVRHLGAPFP